MNKISILTAGLFITSFNVSAMPEHQHEAPFLGINPVMEKCHMIAEDDAFAYQGEAKTKLTINKNFVLATCKAE